MKLLAEAKDNPELFKMKATCTGKGWEQNGKIACFRLWEIDARDIYERSCTDITGHSDTYYGFVCPECGCFTELNENEIPMYVKANAKQFLI